MAYIPDPTNITQPTEDTKASTAAAEFRALKSYIATLAGLSPPSGLGAVTIAQLNGGQLGGMRNKIINGKMEIAQRGTSFAAAFGYTLDRWTLQNTSAGQVTVSQQTDVPSSNEFQSSLRAAITTADTSSDAGDVMAIEQRIEGFNSRDLIGKTFTLSFWVRSSKTGTHCVSFNSGSDRSYVGEYTVNAANTWEQKSVTLPGGLITAGTWNWTNGIGLLVRFALFGGTNFQTTAGAWQTGNFLVTANQVNCLDTVGNIFAITGVQLEPGTVATPFEHRPIGAELSLCQRYYEVGIATLQSPAAGDFTVPYLFKQTKRAIPTLASITVQADSGVTSPVLGNAEIESCSLKITAASSGSFRQGWLFSAAAEL